MLKSNYYNPFNIKLLSGFFVAYSINRHINKLDIPLSYVSLQQINQSLTF